MELYYDEIKRKLRKLKQLEMKIRGINESSSQGKRYINSPNSTELVWNQFFAIKENPSKKVKYSIQVISNMTKEEFKNVINEYLYFVYYHCYKEGHLTENLTINVELLTQLGLPADATDDEIKQRFRELAKKYHPDNGGDNEKFMDIMKMYHDYKGKES